jgi:hypothetical protein
VPDRRRVPAADLRERLRPVAAAAERVMTRGAQ